MWSGRCTFKISCSGKKSCVKCHKKLSKFRVKSVTKKWQKSDKKLCPKVWQKSDKKVTKKWHKIVSKSVTKSDTKKCQKRWHFVSKTRICWNREKSAHTFHKSCDFVSKRVENANNANGFLVRPLSSQKSAKTQLLKKVCARCVCRVRYRRDLYFAMSKTVRNDVF